MKGKLLSIDKLKNMNEQFVYIKPIDINCSNEEGKAKVIIKNNKTIVFRPIFANNSDYDWTDDIDGKNLNDSTWLDIYEWVEKEDQYYKIENLQAFNSEDEMLAKDILNDIIYEYNYNKGSNVQKLQSIIKIINKFL